MTTRRRNAPYGDTKESATSSPSSSPPHWTNNLLFKLIRLVGVWAWIFVSYPILFSGALLRCLNPLLRANGCVNGRMPSDFIQMTWGSVIVWLSGINVVVEGHNNLVWLQKRSAIVMANHSAALDPFILMGYGLVAPKYVFKRSLIFQVPPIFLLAWGYGHIPINRTNRESAVKSLHDGAKWIEKYNRCIAVFPEGTRSKDGRLLPFKRGPFHLAHDTRVPICPIYIEGAWELTRAKRYSFHPDAGTVRVRVFPAIENTATDTVDTLEKKVRDVLEKAQSERKPLPRTTTTGFASLFACVVFIGLAVVEARFLYGLVF